MGVLCLRLRPADWVVKCRLGLVCKKLAKSGHTCRVNPIGQDAFQRLMLLRLQKKPSSLFHFRCLGGTAFHHGLDLKMTDLQIKERLCEGIVQCKQMRHHTVDTHRVDNQLKKWVALFVQLRGCKRLQMARNKPALGKKKAQLLWKSHAARRRNDGRRWRRRRRR